MFWRRASEYLAWSMAGNVLVSVPEPIPKALHMSATASHASTCLYLHCLSYADIVDAAFVCIWIPFLYSASPTSSPTTVSPTVSPNTVTPTGSPTGKGKELHLEQPNTKCLQLRNSVVITPLIIKLVNLIVSWILDADGQWIEVHVTRWTKTCHCGWQLESRFHDFVRHWRLSFRLG